jgi:hypothetical protein
MNLDDLAWEVERLLDALPTSVGPRGDDREVERLNAEYRALVARRDLMDQAGLNRSKKLAAVGSKASFPGGLAKVGESLQPVMLVVTDSDVIALHGDVDADPTGEIARIPRSGIAEVHLTDTRGNPVAASALDPVREFETPEEERYTIVFERSDAQPPFSLLFLSGEPAGFAIRKLREHGIGRA